jgi:hypothetical protein
MCDALNEHLEACLRSPEIDPETKARLNDVKLCAREDTWWMFIASVSDEDHPALQQARVLILCGYLLSDDKRGQLFAVNSANRRQPALLFNPNQDENSCRATETTEFLQADAALGVDTLRGVLQTHRDRCRFIRVRAEAEPDVYVSLHAFRVKNLLMDEPVDAVKFNGLYVSVH